MPITIKAARVNAHMTLATASKHIGVHPSTLCKWENEKSFPNIVQAKKLSELYDVSLDNLIFLTI